MLITDARFPLFHFPPALYNYVTKDLCKNIILVLNKQDLVEPKVIEAWKMYFHKHFPDLKVVCFNSFTIYEQDINPDKKRKMSNKRRKYATAIGRKQLLDTIKEFNLMKNGKPVVVDYEDIDKREKELRQSLENDEEDEEEEVSDNEEDNAKKADPSIPEEGKESITLGCVGHPNVGKSSLINGLMGTKVVSASRTPGHTKHLQTIFFTKQVVLCDCPGLVFPALDRPKALQILCGLFPIAQVRESFSAIRYLAERVPIEKIYGLQHPDPEEKHWTPFYICDAYAHKRGYYLRKGRTDVHRAGLEILKDCVDGVISISWPPPGIDMDSVPDPKKAKKAVKEYDDEDDRESEDEDAPIITKAREKKMKKQQRKKKILEGALEEEEDDTKSYLTLPANHTSVKASSSNKKSAKAEEWKDRLEAKLRKRQ